MLTLRVQVDEVIIRLDQIPEKVRVAVYNKLTQTMAELKPHLFEGVPGKYLDPQNISSGAEIISKSTLVGYIEGIEKTGTYPIDARAKPYLKFLAKSGDIVRTKHVDHPFLKSKPWIIRLLDDYKPWVADQLEDTIIENL